MARSSATTRTEGMDIDRPTVTADFDNSVSCEGAARKLTSNGALAGRRHPGALKSRETGV